MLVTIALPFQGSRSLLTHIPVSPASQHSSSKTCDDSNHLHPIPTCIKNLTFLYRSHLHVAPTNPSVSPPVFLPVCMQMDEIKLKDRAVSVLDKALGLQAGHAHRLQLQTQAAEQQIAAMRDAQRVGQNHPSNAPNATAHTVSPSWTAHAACMLTN